MCRPKSCPKSEMNEARDLHGLESGDAEERGSMGEVVMRVGNDPMRDFPLLGGIACCRAANSGGNGRVWKAEQSQE